jgi:hypothetical protein
MDAREDGSVVRGGCLKLDDFEMSILNVVFLFLDWLSRVLDNQGLKKCKGLLILSSISHLSLNQPNQ